MKKVLLLFIICLNTLCSLSFSSEKYNFRKKEDYRSWGRLVSSLNDDFYKSEEAKRIADNVLLYQLTTGGWPKNIYMPKELSEEELSKILENKNRVNEGTIDNDATTTEIDFLSRVYKEHKDDRYKQAILDGIDYLLEAQYDNGGWPQCYPRTDGYITQIQYNDNSNVNVLKFIREVYENKEIYAFVSDDRIERLKKAFDNGINCILKTQIKQNGQLTVWCAQYDHVTLQPAKARAYELVSLSGQESDNIVLLLMSLQNPSQDVIAAIEGAVEWFKKVQINGFEVVYFTNEEGDRDRKLASCDDCLPLWARFYDIDTNQPFVCDRDGIKRFELYGMSDISHERRMGYKWYNNDGVGVIKRYDEWKNSPK